MRSGHIASFHGRETIEQKADFRAERIAGIVDDVDDLAVFERAQCGERFVERQARYLVDFPDGAFLSGPGAFADAFEYRPAGAITCKIGDRSTL